MTNLWHSEHYLGSRVYHSKRIRESLMQKVTYDGNQHHVKSPTLLQDKLQSWWRKELDIVVCSLNLMSATLQFSFVIRFFSLKANTVRIKNCLAMSKKAIGLCISLRKKELKNIQILPNTNTSIKKLVPWVLVFLIYSSLIAQWDSICFFLTYMFNAS